MSGDRDGDRNSERSLVRGLGFFALVASCFNCTVGGGIFRLPASVHHIAGDLSPLIYLLCFLIMALVAGVFIQVGSSIQVSGGPYAYVKPLLGEYWGYLCGVLLWFLATFAFASVANAYAHFAALLFPAGAAPAEPLILAVSLALLALFNSFGVKSGAKVSGALAVIKILPLAVLVAAGLPHLASGSGLSLPAHWDGSTVARGAMLLIFAFTGVESALIPSGEIADPKRTLPRALLVSLTLVLFLYLGVHLTAQSLLGGELGNTAIPPLAAAAERLMGPTGAGLLAVGAVLSTLGYLSALTLSLPRSLLAFAEDGYLPAVFSRVSPTSKAPVPAIWFQVAVVFGLAASSQFEKLAVLANLSAILMYLLCSVAALVLIRRSPASSAVRPGRALIPVAASLPMLFLLTSVTRDEWFSVLGLLGLATGGYGLRKTRAVFRN
jgi:APA family basic amino acid/polyamine antiporter